MKIMTKSTVDEFELQQFNAYRDGLLIAVQNQFENMKNPYYPPTQQQFKAIMPALNNCLRNEENRKEVVALLLNRSSLATMNDLWRAEVSALIDNIIDMDDYSVYADAKMAIRTAEKIIEDSGNAIDKIVAFLKGVFNE